jgi:NAD(P)-dependent dehydrogenase (short-subunit alcohol dehydrogenase family)
MRVFVTGDTGFIGFAIVKELIGAGHQVTRGTAKESLATMMLITKKDITVSVTVQTRTALPPDRAFQPAVDLSLVQGLGTVPRGAGRQEPDRSMGSRRRLAKSDALRRFDGYRKAHRVHARP